MSAFHHAEKKLYPYRVKDLFDLVANVEGYPEFLPWCLKVDMLARHPDRFTAALVVGKSFMSERFTSHDRLFRPDTSPGSSSPGTSPGHSPQKPWCIEAQSDDGPFLWLRSRWVFHPRGKNETEVDFSIAFELRSSLFSVLLGRFFEESIARLSAAFEDRAQQLYTR